MDLATRFRELRTQAGMTKTALAKPRYTVSYVTQIEKGRRRPSAEAMDFFSRQLGVTSKFLATGVPEGVENRLTYELEQARTAVREGRVEDGERIARKLAVDADRFEMPSMRAAAAMVIGSALVARAEFRPAIDVLEEALQGQLTERDRGMAVASLARAYRSVGDLSYGVDLVESFLLERNRGPLDPAVIAELQAVLVSIYFERGDVTRAERTAARALHAADLGATPEARARIYWNASRVLAEARRWSDALELATRARVIMEELDDRRRVALLHNAYAFICLEAEPPRTEEAAAHLDKAEKTLVSLGNTRDLAYVHSERSRMALLLGRAEEALEEADRATAEAGLDELEAARCFFLKGRALAELGRDAEARAALGDAARRFGDLGARQQEANCWRELGELDLAAGDLQAAVIALQAGLRALDPRRTRA